MALAIAHIQPFNGESAMALWCDDTLPEIASYPDRLSLLALDEASLTRLMAEYRRWRAWTEELCAGLATDPAQTEWHVLMSKDAQAVHEASERLAEEIAVRRRDRIFRRSSLA